MTERVSMIDAARRLGLTYQQAHNLALSGRLEGGKNGARWWVTLASVRKLQRELRRERNNAA